MVDVTGIEPVTPCLQSRWGQNTKCFVWCRLHEPSMEFPLLNCPEVVPSFGGLMRHENQTMAQCETASGQAALDEQFTQDPTTVFLL